MDLLGMPLTNVSPAQAPLVDSAQQFHDSDFAHESMQTQPQLSTSRFSPDPGDLASLSPHSMIPIADVCQTHHVTIEPGTGSQLRQQKVARETDQIQRFNAALTTVSVINKGRRVLKPCINTIPIRLVEMFTQQQLDESIASVEQRAGQLMGKYRKHRAVFDMIDGMTSDQSSSRTREILLRRVRDTVSSIKRRTPLLSWNDFQMARDEAEKKREVWFVVLIARMVGLCLERQHIYVDDTTAREYWFQEDAYKKRCCELEAWKVAVEVLGRAINEEVQRLDQRVDQYLHGNASLSENAVSGQN